MKCPISFGKPSLVLLFPFLMPIFYCLRSYLENTLINEEIEEKKLHPFFLAFIILIANFVMGIPVAINSCFRKSSTFESISMKEFILEKQGPARERELLKFQIQSISLIALTTVLVIFILIFGTVLNSNPEQIITGFRMNIALLLFDSFFSLVILKYAIHKHQILSLGLCVIGIIFVCYGALFQIEQSALFLVLYLIISIVNILEKWLMEKIYFHPEHLIFFIGCFGMGFFIIIFLVTSFVDCPTGWALICTEGNKIEPILELFGIIYKKNPLSFLYMLLIVITTFVYIVFFFRTNYFFSPCHRSLSDILSSFFMWIINNKWDDPVYIIAMHLIGYLIITFAALVYNELLIINCLDIDANTKEEIAKRSAIDVEKGKEEVTHYSILKQTFNDSTAIPQSDNRSADCILEDDFT